MVETLKLEEKIQKINVKNSKGRTMLIKETRGVSLDDFVEKVKYNYLRGGVQK